MYKKTRWEMDMRYSWFCCTKIERSEFMSWKTIKESVLTSLKGILAIIKTFLPKLLPFVLLGGSLVWYSNVLYKEGEKAADERHAELQKEVKAQQDEMEQMINAAVGTITKDSLDRLNAIDIQTVEHKTTIIREIEKDSRYSDPEQGISDTMLNTLNEARKESHK